MRGLFLILLCFTTSSSWAQDLKALISKSTVSVGERFQIEYRTDGRANKFTGPDLSDFRVVGGPNKSVSASFVHGQYTSNVSFSYYLVAQKEGTFNIPPASVVINGQRVESPPLSVKVTAANTPQTPPPSAQQGKKPTTTGDSDIDKQIQENLYVRLYTDRTSAYVGEQITATYKLYFNVEFLKNPAPGPIAYNGFYTQEVDFNPQATLTTEVINGKRFQVATIKQVVLTPQKTGELEVSPMELETVIRVWETSGHSVFSRYRAVPATITSNTVKIHIDPVPKSAQPASYAGAVGTFSMDVAADRSEVAVNEAINLSVTIEGKGNLSLVGEPELVFPTDFEVYEPKLKENIHVAGGGTSGKKVYEYVLIPRHAGTFTIDPVRFAYFDPSKEAYSELRSEPIEVVVERGSGEDAASTNYQPVSKEDVHLIGRDIRYIKTGNHSLRPKREPFFGSVAFIALTAMPMAATGLAFFLVLAWRRKNQDDRETRHRRARSQATKRLQKADKAMNEPAVFYEEVYKAMFGYLSDKLDIPHGALSRDLIEESLVAKGVHETQRQNLKKVLDECEMARFAPGAARGTEQMMQACTDIIMQLENEI